MEDDLTEQPNDVGINQPLITTEESQGTSEQTPEGAMPVPPVNNGNTVNDDFGDTPPTAPSNIGVGAPSEDSGEPTKSSIQVATNAAGALNSRVTPRDNVLDQYASYTYSLSWYLITPDQVKALQATQKINTNQWSLLMQSGGASETQTAESQTGGLGITNLQISSSTGRNKYFTLDYYMDNLVIESSFNNLGMSSANTISFSVIEPNGITLLQNLYRAVSDMYKDTGVTAKDAVYVMAIRFYGYDAQGNLVTNSSPSSASAISGALSLNAVVTKYFPFRIADFEFKAANKAVEYQIKGAPLNDIIGKSSALGSIPQNFEFVGETVDDILNGKATASVSAPVDKDDRAAKNKPTADTGSAKNTTTKKPLYTPSEGILNGGNGGGTSTEALGIGVDY